MSISPPSDIVLDVAQAADPTRLQAATAKLSRMAAGLPAGGFEAALDTAAAPAAGTSSSTAGLALPTSAPGRQAAASPYTKFEAMVLQNFVQNMLPKEDELFGDAASADICRSMLAEQVATQIAKTGKLGIAHMIEQSRNARDHALAEPVTTAAATSPAQAAPAVPSPTAPPAVAVPTPATTRPADIVGVE